MLRTFDFAILRAKLKHQHACISNFAPLPLVLALTLYNINYNFKESVIIFFFFLKRRS